MIPALIAVAVVLAFVLIPLVICAFACQDCRSQREQVRERIRLEAQEWLNRPRVIVVKRYDRAHRF